MIPIEVKSGAGYRKHAALDNVMAVKEFGISAARVLNGEAAAELGKVSYLPVYSTMFFERNVLPDKLVYDI